MKKPTIISIVQHKGGVGKTTSCLHIAEALTKQGKTALVLDLDVQANLSLSLLGKDSKAKEGILHHLANSKKYTDADIIHETSRSGLYIIPNEKRLNGDVMDINGLLGDGPRAFMRIQKLLQGPVACEFDFILIDLPPSKDKTIMNAMIASDYYIIPLEASDYCLDGLDELIAYISEATEINENLELLGMYMPNVDLRLKANKSLIKELKESLGATFMDTIIPTNAKVRNLPGQGKTIFDLKGKEAKGAKEYMSLTKEIIKRATKNQTRQPELR